METGMKASLICASGLVLFQAMDLLVQQSDAFKRWKALGPLGGVKHNLVGFIIVNLAYPFLIDSRDPHTLQDTLTCGYLQEGTLTQRHPSLPRPNVPVYLVPQRQTNQRPKDQRVVQMINATLYDLSRESQDLSLADSLLVSGFSALYILDRRGNCVEIAHLHMYDYSFHVQLHPKDIRLVMQLGWGERHAGAGQFVGTDASHCLVYAPLNEEDVHAVKAIVRSAAEWARAGKVV